MEKDIKCQDWKCMGISLPWTSSYIEKWQKTWIRIIILVKRYGMGLVPSNLATVPNSQTDAYGYSKPYQWDETPTLKKNQAQFYVEFILSDKSAEGKVQ
jgi:hypothetical protein